MLLPVSAILPQLAALLASNRPVALVAPPGAGKTTVIAPALLAQPWAARGCIILLSPRRLAARAAAERMAELARERVGQTIGYQTRMDSKVSAATRIIVMTEGIFTRRLVADPELAGVAAVLFDEVHERSQASDLALALTLDARAALRPDLRLLLMSATLDGAAYEAIVPGLTRLESSGRMFPVTLRHIGRDPTARIEDAMACAIRVALADEPGSILAFLPGAAEIERTADRLEGRLPGDVDLHRLYGAREGTDQRAAIAPPLPGRRKVVLATSIAETSITIDGVRVIIDSGLSRRPRLDRAVGLARLVTERASQAAVTQRAGRAGRTAPGIAIRLWEAAETAGRHRFDPPEILESDLASLLLETARWGVRDPGELLWLDPPPIAAVNDARARLEAIGVLSTDGRPTAHGEKVAALPLPPSLGHMLILAAGNGWGRQAAALAVLIGERGLGGRSIDADERLRRWTGERGQRAEAARKLAARWAAEVGGRPDAAPPTDQVGQLLALAFPDRVARRRGGTASAGKGGGGPAAAGAGSSFLMANGRAVTVPADDALARADWIVVADAAGAAAGTRLLLGAAIESTSVEALLANRIETRPHFGFDAASGSVIAETTRRLGAITLTRQPITRPDPDALQSALLGGVSSHGVSLLPWGEASAALRARNAFARSAGLDLAALDDAALQDSIEDWLAPLLANQRRLGALEDSALVAALQSRLGRSGVQALDRFAPRQFQTPAGSQHGIDYAAEGGPAVNVRVQALFGLAHHPMLAQGRVPLTLRLTSPAGRPIQVTRDLPGFWSGSWADVRRELRGRYPRHPWPETPASASPTLRAKRPGDAG